MKLREILKENSAYDEVSKWLRSIGLSVTMGAYNKGVYVGSGIDLSGRLLSRVPVHINRVNTAYNVSYNDIHTLEYCNLPEEVPYINISHNPIKSLVGIANMVKYMHYKGSYLMEGVLDFSNCPIEEGGLGLLFIDGIRQIKFDSVPTPEPFEIIYDYIRSKRSEFDCQNELIDAGYEAFAQL